MTCRDCIHYEACKDILTYFGLRNPDDNEIFRGRYDSECECPRFWGKNQRTNLLREKNASTYYWCNGLKIDDNTVKSFVADESGNIFSVGGVGCIPDEKTYNDYRDGKIDWRPEMRNRMKTVSIPIEIFERLVALDKGGKRKNDTERNIERSEKIS